jgi:hypothetical protein
MAAIDPNLHIAGGGCRLEDFALFEGPDLGSIAAVDPGCQDVVADIVADHAANDSLTSTHYYFLSELQPFLGENCEHLPCFLKAVSSSTLGHSTLIVDRHCTLTEPLVLPSRFTLAGVGIDGEGGLSFSGLADGVSAIRFAPEARNVMIRDLAIGRADGGVNAGIDFSRAQKVYARNVQVTNFFAGIYGSRPSLFAIYVYLDHCNAFDNDYNLVIHRNAFHWRIRDCILSQANCWGLLIFGPRNDPAPRPVNRNFGWGNDHLISGCSFEGCGTGGVHLGSDSAMLINNRFENNGGVGGVGVQIFSTAARTRLVSNYLSGNIIHEEAGAQDTQEWGTILL